MDQLTQTVLDAHGGVERWNALHGIEISGSALGPLWTRKGYHEVFKDISISIDCHRQFVSFNPFIETGARSLCTPDETVIESASGAKSVRANPRDAFNGQSFTSAWDPLHLAYFSGYAMWNYLATPFFFTWDGVTTHEMEPWNEHGKTWRRLVVNFPPDIAAHCQEQTFYVDERGYIMRVDYTSEITNSGPIAHYMWDHANIDGIVFPRKRRSLARLEDGAPDVTRVFVEISLVDIQLHKKIV
ncbi:hypothetical protein [Paraburkholderia sp. ZP32-5]|uniref:hypothetical protein n=1 Tax=Paraburkholderia sp. ZP32-5 TaxID=2883245 RepID=UPI001F17CFA3|nr:hypothetical protein [Paraburkholderia sp. ZP32-5]